MHFKVRILCEFCLGIRINIRITFLPPNFDMIDMLRLNRKTSYASISFCSFAFSFSHVTLLRAITDFVRIFLPSL